MLYGDGDKYCLPLTALDVCGHEIGHAVCDNTANLQYQNESGALNEGFSDIWGACVEAHAVSQYGLSGKNPWLIGEEIMKPGFNIAIRSLSNPRDFNQPDTYHGDGWRATSATPTQANDYGGVHYNSGVLNYWFYQLTQGGTGTNDLGNIYSVTGVGITKAAKIAYLTEKLLSPTSTFSSARVMALQAAATLYGANSSEVRAVANAWYAVGIGYGVAYGAASSTRFIDGVTLHALNRHSLNDNGYYDGVAAGAPVATLAQCAPDTLRLSAGFTGRLGGTQYWSVWMDFNHDDDFSDTGESIVSNQPNTTDGWLALPFTVPAGALLGDARLRVVLASASVASPCGYVGNGEVEDYLVNVGPAISIGAPSGVNATAVTSSSATLQWIGVASAAAYNVLYRPSGTVLWALTTASTSSASLAGLTAGGTYQFKVQAVNGCGTAGPYSAIGWFMTVGRRPAGLAPGTPGTPTDPAAPAATAYPNPATSVLHLRLTTRDGEAAPKTVEVYDLRGIRVASATYDGHGALNIAALPPGLYSATLRGERSVTVRFMKE